MIERVSVWRKDGYRLVEYVCFRSLYELGDQRETFETVEEAISFHFSSSLER